MDYTRICINCMHEKRSAQEICPNCGFNPATYKWPSYALEPYTILNGKYLVGRVLGAGGFGITYIAFDMVLETTRAIKEFFLQGSMYRMTSESTGVSVVNGSFPQEQMYKINREKFMQEARLLAQLDNLPGIVSVYDFFNENDTSYMVLEYLEGQTLKQYVKSHGGKLGYEEVLEKVHPVIKSLEQLHERGIYHRDISPDNLMVMRDGSLTLFDFGGARVQNANNDNRSVMVMKKTGYTPVEQYVDGEQGPWTDEYAMAATIYYCICGIVPPESVTRTAGADTLRKPRSMAPDLPAAQEAAILKGLGLRKDDRYPNMNAFEQALYDKKKKKEAPPKKRLGPVLVLLALLAAAGGAFAAFQAGLFGKKSSHTVTVRNSMTNQVTYQQDHEAGALVAVPALNLESDGYTFAGWEGDTDKLPVEEQALQDANLQFEMPDEDVTLITTYVGLPVQLSFAQTDPDITVSAEPAQDTYLVGEEITLHAQVAEGWDFDGWSADNDAVVFSDPASETTTFTVPVGGAAVSAAKKQHAYQLTVVNGTVSGGKTACIEGDTVTITANAPREGETFLRWSVEGAGEEILADAAAKETTLTMPGGDITVRALYQEKTYTLEYYPEDIVRIVSGTPEEDGGYLAGTQITIEAEVPANVVFVKWQIMGKAELEDVDLNQNPLTFQMPASDLSLVANTTDNEVYVQADGVIGYEKSQAFRPGDQVTLQADVDGHLEQGEAFETWVVTDGDLTLQEEDLTAPVLTFTMPETSVSIEARYQKIDYTVSYYNGVDEKPQQITYHKGDPVSIEAAATLPDQDQTFAEWTVEEGAIDYQISGEAGNVISFEMPNESVTIRAVYQANVHTLTVKTLDDTQTFSYATGDEVSYSATSITEGKQFIRWNVTQGSLTLDESAIRDPELHFTMPPEDVTVEAEYEDVEYVVTVTYDGDGTTVQYGHSKGDIVELEALSFTEEDLDFDYWSVDSRNIELEDPNQPVISFEMPEDQVTLTAHYKQAEHTLLLRVDNLEESYPYETGALVSQQTAETYDGRHFIVWTVEQGDVTLEDPSSTVISFTMPAEDVILEAHYGYVLTVAGGSIRTVDDQDAGGIPSAVIKEGAQVTITADPPQEGDLFAGWSWSVPNGYAAPEEDGESVTFTMPKGDVSAEVQLIKHTKMLVVENGTGSGEYTEGERVTISAYDHSEGHMIFTGWSTDHEGYTINAEPTITIEMPGYDLTVAANYIFYTDFAQNLFDQAANNTSVSTQNGQIDYMDASLMDISSFMTSFFDGNESTGKVIYKTDGTGTKNLTWSFEWDQNKDGYQWDEYDQIVPVIGDVSVKDSWQAVCVKLGITTQWLEWVKEEQRWQDEYGNTWRCWYYEDQDEAGKWILKIANGYTQFGENQTSYVGERYVSFTNRNEGAFCGYSIGLR